MAASTVQVRLSPTHAQERALVETVRRCNAAATSASKAAWTSKTFRRFELHKLVYRSLRADFGLAAQAAVHVIGRVSGAYANRRSSKKRAHVFRPLGAVSYDSRILSFNHKERVLSIWTLAGRQTMPYIGRGEDLAALEHLPVGECDLLLRRGKWLLQCSVTLPDAPLQEPVSGFLGVDKGIKFLVVTSDGMVLPGLALRGTVKSNGHFRSICDRRHRQRTRMQARGTAAARRRLKTLAGREARFVADLNHQVSKHVVREAERTGRGVALEDLKGIRERIRAPRSQRRTMHNWSYRQLDANIRYKAQRAGVVVVMVNPAYTSQMCPSCDHTSRTNRPGRDFFRCANCGLAGPADYIAALNIAARGKQCWAAANRPYAA